MKNVYHFNLNPKGNVTKLSVLGGAFENILVICFHLLGRFFIIIIT